MKNLQDRSPRSITIDNSTTLSRPANQRSNPEAPVYESPEDIIIRNMGAAKIANNCITSGAIHRLPSVNKIEEEGEGR